ncbi:MAG: ATP-dependent Clp protease proteolytic subunit, partial [Patescibacteria group bacterium]|nr:ATP-dependent Clp protease proteolytic subunit [Patescibacteria group bacterium]
MYKDKIAALLSKKRIINVFAEITRESGMADEIVEAIISLNAISNDPITIHINSIGGESDQSLLAYDAIKFSKAPVHGIVIGKAFSGSAVILQACTKRLATANSGILVHYGDHHLKVESGKLK